MMRTKKKYRLLFTILTLLLLSLSIGVQAQQKTFGNVKAAPGEGKAKLVDLELMKTTTVPARLVRKTRANTADSAWTLHLDYQGRIYAYRYHLEQEQTQSPVKPGAIRDSAAYQPGIFKMHPIGDCMFVGMRREKHNGGLYYMSGDRENTRKFSDGDVYDIRRIHDSIFVVHAGGGIDSLKGYLEGVFIAKDGKWWVKPIGIIPGVPYTMDVDEAGNFLVMASTGLYLVDPHFETHLLLALHAKQALPTMMLVKNNIAYVAFNDGILQVDVTRHKAGWLQE